VTKQRQHGPDIVRGLLLALVIFGHTFYQSVDHSHIKWMIYSFHMPLFFMVTGSLMSMEKLRTRRIQEISVHYAKRMGWQWLLVSIAFAVYRHVSYSNALQPIQDLLLDPYFHLWFVPALFLMILMTWCAARLNMSLKLLLVVAFALWMVFTTLPALNPDSPLNNSEVDLRFLGLYVWFVLGLNLKGREWSPRFVTLAAVTAIVGGGLVFLTFPVSNVFFFAGSLMLNGGLGFCLLRLYEVGERSRFLHRFAAIGRYSLWIYLLHPFATDLIRKSSPPGTVVQGLVMTAGVLLVSGACASLGRFVRN
jgi:fucose 4-O-acetylase-like acetyltransferase